MNSTEKFLVAATAIFVAICTVRGIQIHADAEARQTDNYCWSTSQTVNEYNRCMAIDSVGL